MKRFIATAATVAALMQGATFAAQAEGDPAQGEKTFRLCMTCHVIEPGGKKIGPSLYGVVGREAGSLEGFKYSDAMANAGIVWTEENLDKYLANPREFIPGNRMAFAGLRKQEDRDNVIAYLKSVVE